MRKNISRFGLQKRVKNTEKITVCFADGNFFVRDGQCFFLINEK